MCSAARRCVAARGARAAGRARAAHRHAPARSCGRCGISDLGRGVPAGDGAIGLDHRPQPAHRYPLGHDPMPPTFADTRRNWPRSRRTSSWPLAASTVGPLLQATRTVPIVFPIVVDPVGAGFVDSLARPGGKPPVSAVRIQLEREMAGAAQGDRAGRDAGGGLRDPAKPTGTGQFAAIQAVAPSLRVEVNPVNMRDAGEIERAVAAFAHAPNGGLIVTASAAVDSSSRSDHHAGGPAQAARGLLRTLLRRRRRPGLLWT